MYGWASTLPEKKKANHSQLPVCETGGRGWTIGEYVRAQYKSPENVKLGIKTHNDMIVIQCVFIIQCWRIQWVYTVTFIALHRLDTVWPNVYSSLISL